MDNTYSIENIAEKLHISKRTVLREIKRGKIQTLRAGRKHLISEKELERYLKQDESYQFDDSLQSFFIEHKSEMVSILQRMVVMSSTSIEHFDTTLAEHIVKILDDWGIRNVLYQEGDGVAVKATFGYKDTGILLNCPLDIVPPGDLSQWSHPPFEGVIEKGKMYGRGTADCKGGIVAMLFTLLFLKKNVNEEDVKVEVVFDGGKQDGTFLGMKQVLAKGLMVNAGIVGYAGDLENIHTGARGYHGFEIVTLGYAVHTGSRFKNGVNAINSMVHLISELSKEKLPVSKDPFFSSGSQLTFTQVSGGNAMNTVPDSCTAKLDVWTTPELSKSDIETLIKNMAKKIREIDPGFNFEMTYIAGHEAYTASAKTPLFQALQIGINEIYGTQPEATASGSAHIGNLLAEYDIPVAVWGPKGENMHSYDEYIEIDSLPMTAQIYVKTILHYFLLAKS